MKYIREFLKFIEAALFVAIIPLMFYWSLTLIHANLLKPLIAFLGLFYDPLLSFVKNFYTFSMNYQDVVIDFSYFILALVFIFISLIISFIRKFLEFGEGKVAEAKFKAYEQEKAKKKQDEKNTFIEELNQNKVIYLKMFFGAEESKSSYLHQDDSSQQSKIDSYKNEFIEFSKKYDAKQYKNENDTLNLVFYNIAGVVEYLSKVYKGVSKINEDFSKAGINFKIKAVSDCKYDELNAQKTFENLQSVLNLAGEREFVVSKLFKDKYELLNLHNISFDSKGLYFINNKQVEVFSVKIK